mmetsp:Transcript_41318/g.96401  ORF Transcript_41318/g.96401 Transcript_41318/m.96401 type:complete len:290 (-) Transcript_41318:1598-2467(-)
MRAPNRVQLWNMLLELMRQLLCIEAVVQQSLHKVLESWILCRLYSWMKGTTAIRESGAFRSQSAQYQRARRCRLVVLTFCCGCEVIAQLQQVVLVLFRTRRLRRIDEDIVEKLLRIRVEGLELLVMLAAVLSLKYLVLVPMLRLSLLHCRNEILRILAEHRRSSPRRLDAPHQVGAVQRVGFGKGGRDQITLMDGRLGEQAKLAKPMRPFQGLSLEAVLVLVAVGACAGQLQACGVRSGLEDWLTLLKEVLLQGRTDRSEHVWVALLEQSEDRHSAQVVGPLADIELQL